MREREAAQLSFADVVVGKLGGKRTQALMGQLDAAIDWELPALPVRAAYRNADGGAPAAPAVMMLKIVLLQKWFKLSDPQAEEQLNDRISFRRFAGLRGDEAAPDESTLVKFHGRLCHLAEATYMDDDAARLGQRLGKYRDQLFTFLDTPGVPSDNNHAERQIRPAVIIRKNSLCNRSEQGAATQGILMSVYRTLKLRGLDATKTIAEALRTFLQTGKLPALPVKTVADG
jgi:transposase